MFNQKYTKIILSISGFIILDLILFGLNYYATERFESDTKSINRASELRMLSQQLTKSLLTLQIELRSGVPTQSSLSELTGSTEQFDENVQYFLSPTFTKSTDNDRGALIALNVKKIHKEWLIWKNELNPLLKEINATSESIDFAATKLNTKNIYLLALCDDLIKEIEANATRQSIRLKIILYSILFFAVLNFLYIVFIFIKQLENSDNEIEISHIQKNRILSAVNEGLLLIKPDGRIAKEMSNSIHRHFGKTILSDIFFIDLFDGHLSASEKDKVFKYINLNLKNASSVNILKQLHPLKEVKLLINGNYKYLSFDFIQIIEHNAVAELLVTVTDITDIAKMKSKLSTVI